MKNISRRTFLYLTGSSGAALAATPGDKFINKLIPYINPPQYFTPGEWLFYATTCRECPAGCGMHIRHRDGRVTKAEGNPGHPVNDGTLCARGQSSLQGLYDPDRVKKVYRRENGATRSESWETALQEIGSRIKNRKGRLLVLSDLQTGTLAEIMQQFAAGLGAPEVLYYETYNYDALKKAHQSVFGKPVVPRYNLENADLILSFAADFLETWISPVEFARQFSRFHEVKNGKMGRFVYLGPRMSMTAANADEYIRVSPDELAGVAGAIVDQMSGGGQTVSNSIAGSSRRRQTNGAGNRSALSIPETKIKELARLLSESRNTVVLAGPQAFSGRTAQEIAEAAARLNSAAGSIGKNIDFSQPHALTGTASEERIRNFFEEATPDDILIVHHSNIAFYRPEVIEKIRHAGTVVYLTDLPDETSELADWILPLDTPLESWGDYEPYRGLHSLIQPTIKRMYNTRSSAEIFIGLAEAAGRKLSSPVSGQPAADDREWLLQRWKQLHSISGENSSFNDFWKKALRNGGYSEVIPAEPMITENVRSTSKPVISAKAPEAGRAKLWLWPSIFLFDGRLANRNWMQIAPHPMSFISWAGWIDIHPEKAAELEIETGDVLQVISEAGSVRLPANVTEEVAPDTIAMPIGQGHTAGELQVAAGIGDNPLRLLPHHVYSGSFPEVIIKKTGGHLELPRQAYTKDQHERKIIRSTEVEKVRNSRVEKEEIIWPTPEGYNKSRDLYRPHEHKNHRWAMVIDLHRCIGCGACGVACYAENNNYVQDRGGVLQGLEMSWLKVVPYITREQPRRIAWLPMLCQHCDAAPCEPVCPVFAAVHNEEGLNAQIYNRCVGTRYCSNNCPYKVRRFNWDNTNWREPLNLQLNPEVSVRSRGVMEKCTFCVQRIRHAEYRAKQEHRELRDGEVVPACVQTCPAGVFTFGDLKDPESKVSRMYREESRGYQVLKELNTKPAILYLKKIYHTENGKG
ncbi:MAG: molybdopterin dinucleotide binding domain-containing protein [Calditrichia bacterium]